MNGAPIVTPTALILSHSLLLNRSCSALESSGLFGFKWLSRAPTSILSKVREPPLQEKSVFYLCNLRSIIWKLIRIVTVYYMFVYPLCFSNQCKKRLTVVFYKHSLQCIPYFRRMTNKSEDRKLHLIFEKVH